MIEVACIYKYILPVASADPGQTRANKSTMAASNNTARTGTGTGTTWLRLSLPLLVLVLLITPVSSRQGLTSTFTLKKGSEFSAWRKDVIEPDRVTDLVPPAPKANSNVPGGPSFG
ncbi:hypothetical protein U9M48_044495 [Paspalum notatum var. saurae]|uniref:Uncharacterized protein n=1 Tax=Paspalum notatum var. saurae TaxID=547442 RepID=A0AAQ3XGS4_PASNO